MLSIAGGPRPVSGVQRTEGRVVRTVLREGDGYLQSIVLASGAGALGVQLGAPVAEGVEVAGGLELGLGDPADADTMQSAVGLVWRATVLWMLLLFLLELASLVG